MKISVCTPVHWHPTFGYTNSLAGLLIYSAPQVDLAYLSHQNTNVLYQRTQLAREALERGVDALLWIDADHSFPPDALIRLLNHRQHVVGANYPMRQEPHDPTAGRIRPDQSIERVQTTADSTGLEAVDGLGFGLILIARQVFEKVPEPWFDSLSEDFDFCAKARMAGFNVMLDHDLSREIGHITETVLRL